MQSRIYETSAGLSLQTISSRYLGERPNIPKGKAAVEFGSKILVFLKKKILPQNLHSCDQANVHLSKEIISNQPVTSVESLNIQIEDVTPFPGFNGTDHYEDDNSMTAEPPSDHEMIEEENDDNGPVVEDANLLPDTTQNTQISDEIVEILSDSDDEDCDTIRYRLNNNTSVPAKQEFSVTLNDTDEAVCISSDEEGDITDSFHCFYCNGRFSTLCLFGEHQQICFLKPEPNF